DGQSFMSLFADGTVAHSAGFEAFHDRFNRFDIVDGYRLAWFELEQSAQRAKVAVLLINKSRVFFENFVIIRTDSSLEFMNSLRIEQMVLAIFAPLILAAGVQDMTIDGAIGKGLPVA